MENVKVDLGGVNTTMDFELIEIMEGIDDYPTLLGMKCDYENYWLIDLKNRMMIFEANDVRETQPLDPHQGSWCTKLVQGNL